MDHVDGDHALTNDLRDTVPRRHVVDRIHLRPVDAVAADDDVVHAPSFAMRISSNPFAQGPDGQTSVGPISGANMAIDDSSEIVPKATGHLQQHSRARFGRSWSGETLSEPLPVCWMS